MHALNSAAGAAAALEELVSSGMRRAEAFDLLAHCGQDLGLARELAPAQRAAAAALSEAAAEEEAARERHRAASSDASGALELMTKIDLMELFSFARPPRYVYVLFRPLYLILGDARVAPHVRPSDIADIAIEYDFTRFIRWQQLLGDQPHRSWEELRRKARPDIRNFLMLLKHFDVREVLASAPQPHLARTPAAHLARTLLAPPQLLALISPTPCLHLARILAASARPWQVPSQVMEEVREMVEAEDFDLHRMAQVSRAAHVLGTWLRATVQQHDATLQRRRDEQPSLVSQRERRRREGLAAFRAEWTRENAEWLGGMGWSMGAGGQLVRTL